MSLPFGWEFAALSAFQGVLVAVGMRRPWHLGASWLTGVAIPVVALVTGVVTLRSSWGPDAIATLAIFGAPLAALVCGVATGWRPLLALVGAPLCLLAAWRLDGYVADAGAVLLIGGACLTLAAVIAAAAPGRAIAAGLVILAVVDTVLVFRGHISPSTQALHAVQPPSAAGHELPALQDATFGGALFGWLDLLSPALAGMLFVGGDRRRPAVAVLTGVGALAWGLMLSVSDTIPGTVPPLLAVAAWALTEPPRTQMRVREVAIPPASRSVR